jgi:hypothetical protein
MAQAARDDEEDRIVRPPLQGLWRAVRSPGHDRYAFDFAATDEGGRLFSVSMLRALFGSSPVETAYGWGRPVHCPVDGKVVAAVDGVADSKRFSIVRSLVAVFAKGMVQRPDPGNLADFAGNHLVIASPHGHVLLAHLRSGSLKVGTGDAVAQGEIVGEVGNSGNSAFPHLHFQLNAGPDLLASPILPFAFTRYARCDGSTWVSLESTTPEKGWLLRL